MAQLIKPQIKWTDEKIALLKLEYPLGDKEKLAKTIGVSRSVLNDAARRFKVKSLQDKHLYKLKILYEDSMLSYYWMGFIMADGYLDNEGELKITLSVKDKIHLQKIADLLGSNIRSHALKTKITNSIFYYCTVSCKDSHFGKLILNKFKLTGLAKTYNPPKILDIREIKYFLAFLIGFIDGDGTFSRQNGWCSFIRLEMYSSWIKILEQIKMRLFNLDIVNVVTGINSRGFSYLKIYKHQNLKYLKLFGLYYKLPLLERKWNTINHDKTLLYLKINDKKVDMNNFYENG